MTQSPGLPLVPERSDGPLRGLRLDARGEGVATRHAAWLMASLGAVVTCDGRRDVDGVLEGDLASAAADWAGSGAMALTGLRDGPALMAPGAVASAARGALQAIEVLARVAGVAEVPLPGAEVLGERAAVAGLSRHAPSSAGGAFRVLRARDGWLGVNLARASDVELLPAWLGAPVDDDPWTALTGHVADGSAGALAERARLLGLPVAALPSPAGGADEQLAARGQDGGVRPVVLNGQVHGAAAPGSFTPATAPTPARSWALPPTLVVDLSSLWAGPLCGHLLTSLGARVVKVESTHRPDGARSGPAAFYDLLHAGQESVAVDFGSAEGRTALAGLIAAADVVIEGSRPRALRQLGIDAEDVLAAARDKVWVSITAYGSTGPWSNAVGFGDDTALAGGLLAFDADTGTPAPCGDAIADPLAGVHAAVLALACRLAGGTWFTDVALREQVAATLAVSTVDAAETSETAEADPAEPVVAERPRARQPAGVAPALGADTAKVLSELGLS